MAVEITYSSVYQFFFKMYFVLSFLGCCGKSVAGMVTLSPMMVAPVCRVGDPLQLTCTASVEFIRWSIVVVNERGMEEEITTIRNSIDLSPEPKERMINSTTFTFSRTSAEDVSPLISTLSIDSVSISLNGTVVNCMDANNPMTSNSTTIQIIDLYTPGPKVGIISEDFGADNVTVTVEWTPHMGITMYMARISPLARPTLSTSTPGLSNRRLLILSYNTSYNLTVVAVTPCGNTTAFIELKYAKCGHPNLLQVNNDSIPIIDAYDSIPFLEGSTIRFSCPSGYELIGPNSANCTGNGEWEPDPSGLMCNVSEVMCENFFNKFVGSSLYILDYSEPAVVGTTVSFNCSQPGKVLIGPNTVTCMDGGQWIPDPSQLQMSCIDGGELDSNRAVIIASGSFGALAVFLVIFLPVVGATVCIKKDSFSNHRKPLVLNNIELDEEHAYNVLVHNSNQQNKETSAGNLLYADVGSRSNDRSQQPPRNVHDQQNKERAENIVYADVGPLSNNQTRSTGNSLDLDEHRVEYAQLNHKANISVPLSAAEKSINEDIALNLDSLLIQLQNKVTQDWYHFGAALGVEKEVLDQCLKYPPEQSIIEIVDHWLRSHVEQSWKEIARALRQINYHQLAEDIESIHKTGKLLIEVNVDDVPDDVLHKSQFDDGPPPPIPPKRFEEDPEESQYEDVIKSCAAPIRPPRPPKP